MVRKVTIEQRETTPTATDVLAPGVRARSFAGTNLDIDDMELERAVLARADSDFKRLFGAG